MRNEESEPTVADHRVRVGGQRHEKTRLRLLERALTVFNKKGQDVAVIDDFITAADASRGTFYNGLPLKLRPLPFCLWKCRSSGGAYFSTLIASTASPQFLSM
jgi:hypothetical protein